MFAFSLLINSTSSIFSGSGGGIEAAGLEELEEEEGEEVVEGEVED
jgi:hypothetical protein